MDEQRVRADSDLIAVAQLSLSHAFAINECAVSAAVPQDVRQAAADDFTMAARYRVAVEDDLAIFIAPDSRGLVRQKQSRAAGAQPTGKTQPKFARLKTGCSSPFAKRYGDSGFLRSSEIVFLTDHCGFDPSKSSVGR